LRTIQEDNKRLQIKRNKDIIKIKDDIVSMINSHEATTSVPQCTLAHVSEKLKSLVIESEKEAGEQRILNSLQFTSMTLRRSAIPEAHKNTFSWIFDSASSSHAPSSFQSWLENGTGVYWVAGKAGSGKSTFMKYLYYHRKTRKLLLPWAGHTKLVMAGFFFWNAGARKQHSQEGLFRSLLFEVLRQCPGLIQTVCSSRWTRQKAPLNEPWTPQELVETFERLIRHSVDDTKFCIFIDGLDDYSGDHQELVNLLKSVFGSSIIKLCISSRPRNIFQENFGGDKFTHLLLEDLTRNDIKLFIREKLEDNVSFQNLEQKDPRCRDLAEEIVNKAQGVFLWVTLVVRSLLKGLTNADRIADLQRRLREFPQELEPYFKHMLDQIEDIYQEESAQLFYIALSADEPHTLATYMFMIDDEHHQDAMIQDDAPIHFLSVDEIKVRFEVTKKRLNARCLDLLEIQEVTDSKVPKDMYSCYIVDFLHKSARDFFLKSNIRSLLASRVKPDFQVSKALCSSFVRQTKLRPERNTSPVDRGTLEELWGKIVYYELELETKIGETTFEALEKLDAISNMIYSKQTLGDGVVFVDPSTYLAQRPFLENAIRKKLYVYAAVKLHEDPGSMEKCRKQVLLDLVLLRCPPSSPHSSQIPAIVGLLLDNGAKLFKETGHQAEGENSLKPPHPLANTPWNRFAFFMEEHRHEVKQETLVTWFKVVKMIILRDSIHSEIVNIPTAPSYLALSEAFHKIFLPDDASRLDKILERYTSTRLRTDTKKWNFLRWLLWR